MRSARHFRRSIAAVVGAIALLVALATTAVATTGSVRMIEFGGRYAFSPRTISVHVGDRVTWTNASDAPHTVTSDTAGLVNSPTIAAAKAFSMTFSSVGTVAYHCTIHSYMHGTIQVLAAGATLPATDTSPTTNAEGSDWIVALLAGLLGLGGALWRFSRGTSAALLTPSKGDRFSEGV